MSESEWKQSLSDIVVVQQPSWKVILNRCSKYRAICVKQITKFVRNKQKCFHSFFFGLVCNCLLNSAPSIDKTVQMSYYYLLPRIQHWTFATTTTTTTGTGKMSNLLNNETDTDDKENIELQKKESILSLFWSHPKNIYIKEIQRK